VPEVIITANTTNKTVNLRTIKKSLSFLFQIRQASLTLIITASIQV